MPDEGASVGAQRQEYLLFSGPVFSLGNSPLYETLNEGLPLVFLEGPNSGSANPWGPRNVPNTGSLNRSPFESSRILKEDAIVPRRSKTTLYILLRYISLLK